MDDLKSKPLSPLHRYTLLAMQEIKERFYLSMMPRTWYVFALEKANDVLAVVMPKFEKAKHPSDEAIEKDTAHSHILDSRGKSMDPSSIGPHHLNVLTGSSSLTLDMSPRDSLSYIIRTARGVKQAIKQALDSDVLQEVPLAIENGNMTSRWVTRGDKYHLARNPDYHAAHVVPFAQEMFFPRVADIQADGSVKPFSEEQVTQNLRLNFLTYSYGALRLKMAINLTADYMKEIGYEPEVVERALLQIQALEIAGNYTRTIDDNHQPKHHFISVGSIHDRYMIRGANFERERAWYECGHYAIPMGNPSQDNWHVWIDTMPRKVEIDNEGRRSLSAERHGEHFTFSGHLLYDYLEALVDKIGVNSAARAALLTLVKACETGCVASFADEYSKISKPENRLESLGVVSR